MSSKSFLVSLLAIFFSCPIHAQSIDKVQYRITYRAEFVNDTTLRDSAGRYVYGHDEVRLDIGSKCSRFYSAREDARARWIDDVIKRGGEAEPNQPEPPRAELLWSCYCNYPTMGKYCMLMNDSYGLYRVEDSIGMPQWQLDADTCTILGYLCTKAETSYKGRHWTAWFAEDIPINSGPWLLCNLPGLIMKAEDAERQWRFTAIGLQQVAGGDDLQLDRRWKRYDDTTWQKYNKMRRTTTMDDLLQAKNATSGTKFTVADKNGEELSPEEYKQRYKTVVPYNPIDRSTP